MGNGLCPSAIMDLRPTVDPVYLGDLSTVILAVANASRLLGLNLISAPQVLTPAGSSECDVITYDELKFDVRGLPKFSIDINNEEPSEDLFNKLANCPSHSIVQTSIMRKGCQRLIMHMLSRLSRDLADSVHTF